MTHSSLDRYLKKIYIVLMTVLITWYLYSIMSFSPRYTTPVWIAVLRCMAAVLAVYLGKMWRDRGFWALAVYFLIILGRVLFPATAITESSVQEMLLFAVWLFGACYGMGRVLTKKEAKTLWTILISIWTVGMAVYSLIGIYAAWTDRTVYALGGRSRWEIGGDMRMQPIFYSNTAASMLVVSALLLLCRMMDVEHKWILIPGMLALVSMIVLIALTDSRIEMASFSAGFGGVAAYALFSRIRKKQNRSNVMAVIAGVACLLVFTVGMFWCLGRVPDIFNQAKTSGGLVIPSALAEGDQSGATMLIHRGLNADTNTLNGRVDIWEKVIGYIKDNLKTLLTGKSVLNPMADFAETESGINYSHCHCTPLQVLLESGIPGLLCVGIFMVVLLCRSLRLLNPNNTVSGWLRFLPFTVLAVCAADLVECFMVLFRYYTPQQALVFIVMGLICARGGKKDPDEIPA